ncbi:MAG: efflux RND transporter permease subunit [Lentisphaerae bacterium]|nr:efflux RND transporter permease subunit [Lentisphaerota bacterium]
MTLSDLSIRRPVFAWMLMFGLIVFGAISFGRMGVSLMPDVDFPLLNIGVTWEGAAPELMEAEIVDKVEQAVISVEGLKETRSTIRQGQANIELEFELQRDVDAALQEVQAALSQVRLPLNVDAPVIRKNSTESEPIMWLGLSGNMPLRELIEYIDTFLVDQFQVLPGVGEVSLGGYSDRNLRLWVDNDKLRAYDLTILDLQAAIEDEHTELAGGFMEDPQHEMNVRTMGEGMTPEAVGDILIGRRGGQPIYDTTIRVRDVARVEDGLSDVRRLARFGGQPGVSLGIRKQRGSNEVAIGKAVKAKIDELNPTLPEGMRLQVNVDFTRFVERAVQATEHELLLAGLLTALICFLFLGSWTSGFNVILSIPTSIVGTFTILYFMGFTLNTFTLLALALSIGIVVDDAIMVLENIIRHFAMGKGKVSAARDGAREITFAATAATLAVIAIFLPVAFMQGIIGKFFFQFGITLTAAVALSLLEAITLTPMRLSQMLVRQARPSVLERAALGTFAVLARAYAATLRVALRIRWLVLVAALVLFLASLKLGALLGREFVPTQDQNFIRMTMQTAVGSSLALTDSKVREAEAYIQSRPEVARYFVSVGGMGGAVNQAFAGITLVDRTLRPLSQADLMAQFRRDLTNRVAGIRFGFQDLSTRGLSPRRSQPVEFNLRGADYDVLNEKAKAIMNRLEQSGLVVDLDTNYRAGMPELQVVPDRAAAAARGVTMDSIGRTINAAIGGVRQGKFTRDGRRYDVRLRLNPEERLTEDDVRKLTVRTSYGEVVPLADVVKVQTVKTLQTVSRVNRQRAISVTANLAAGASQADALRVAEQISREELSPGYTYNLEGGAKTFEESFGNLWFAFLLGIVVAYMVLASQFNSFVHPFTVLLALPFSISGALATLYVSHQSINLYSAIGVILLMGIVKKNSILLVEFANAKRHDEGLPVRDAMLAAAPIRLRPILMTSLATVGAAVPMALGLGPGSETRQPMALAVIGGVIVSTLFTLVVVPCAYVVMARLERHKTDAQRAADEAREHAGVPQS